MEDRKLTEKESLDLISQMIQNSKKNVNQNAASPMLIWGYVTIVVSLLVYAGLEITQNPLVNWGWILIPIVGGLIFYNYAVKHRQPLVKTHLDKVMNAVWCVMGFSCTLMMIPSFLTQGRFSVAFATALMLSQATTITGWIVNCKPYIIGGITGILLSVLCLIVKGNEQILVFVGVFVVMMIIPGHMMNREMKKLKG